MDSLKDNINIVQKNADIEDMTEISNEAIAVYIKYLVGVRGNADKTVCAYSADLADFAAYCANYDIIPEHATRAELELFISDMSLEGKAPLSVNRALSALRGFFRYLARFNLREDNPAETLRNIKAPKKLPVFLWEDEMSRFAKLPETAGILWEARDKAIIMLMYSAGLRISELVSLTLDSLERDYRGARVTGKGDKERVVFFSDEARATLLKYLPERSKKLAGWGCDALFINLKGWPLSDAGARWIIEEYAKRSGINKNIHPHSLRHSFATHLMAGGCDIRVVQELLGHASLTTTQVYTHTTINRLKDVYRKAHPHA